MSTIQDYYYLINQEYHTSVQTHSSERFHNHRTTNSFHVCTNQTTLAELGGHLMNCCFSKQIIQKVSNILSTRNVDHSFAWFEVCANTLFVCWTCSTVFCMHLNCCYCNFCSFFTFVLNAINSCYCLFKIVFIEFNDIFKLATTVCV